ncbi:MAG TPA: glycosyltransferase [Actinomycetota bacterium]
MSRRPLPSTARFRHRSRKRILYIQFTDPACYPVLVNSARALSRAGWTALFLGVTAWGDASVLRHPRDTGVTARLLSLSGTGVLQKSRYLLYCVWVCLVALYWRPDCVYVSDLWACPLAIFLKKLLHVRVVYQELDSPAAAEGSNLGLALRFCLAARRRLAALAEACVVPNEGRALAFVQAVGSDAPVVTAMNCPLRDEGSIARSASDRPEFRITYHGSLNPTRLPLSVVQALADLPGETTLQLIGYETVGAAGYAQVLRRRMLDLGLGDRVRVVGVVPERNVLLGLCRDADVGLALMASEADLNERTMAGASQKVFEYLACGLPVLVSDSDFWRELFVEPGFGLCCDPSDPESIAGQLGWFATHREAGLRMGELGRTKVLADWNYETQFGDVLDLLESRYR